MLTCISCETFRFLGKVNRLRETIKPKETPASLPLTATIVTALMLLLFFFYKFFFCFALCLPNPPRPTKINNNIDAKNKETKWENPLRFKSNQTRKK